MKNVSDFSYDKVKQIETYIKKCMYVCEREVLEQVLSVR